MPPRAADRAEFAGPPLAGRPRVGGVLPDAAAADLSAKEARFSVEDEGEGFKLSDIPDPLDPANLFKTSGRGVLLIYNIMDEVAYNDRGNRLTMVKRPDASLEHDLIESLTPDEKAAEKN